METIVIVSLVMLSVVIIIYATKFLSDTFKIATKVMLIMIVLLSISTVLIYNDLQDLRRDVAERRSIFILRQEGDTYAAVGFEPSNETVFDFDSFSYFDSGELAEIDRQLDSGEELTAGAERTFIFTPRLLDREYSLDLGVSLTEKDILEILQGNDTYGMMADKLNPQMQVTRQNLERIYGHEGRIKGYLLAALVINYFRQRDEQMARHIKDSDFRMVPETPSFKLIRHFPWV